MMDGRRNGWSVIARYLDLHNRKQCDLARLLRLSPAAVTQIKKGETLLNPEQLATVIKALRISEPDVTELYTEIFNARILRVYTRPGCEYQVVKKKREPAGPAFRPIPSPRPERCELKLLIDYEPALENLSDFLARRSAARLQNGCVSIPVGAAGELCGLPPRAVLRIAVDTYPVARDLVLAALRDGGLLLRRFLPQTDSLVRLKCDYLYGRHHLWNRTEDPGYVRWMRPVREIAFDFREE